jgi:hypothetical protein|tara:strand:- start:1953 stop:2864 length:912 start_codon:yes stop_codon:yes gene_type:complete
MQNQEEVINEINDEIKKAKAEPEDFEIEITDNPAEEAKDVAEEKKAEEKAQAEQAKQEEYGEKVQKRIQKLVAQRKDAELQVKEMQEQNAQLNARLLRLEQGANKNTEQAFNQRYSQVKQALEKAVEEGDTKAQLAFTEQLADMRAAVRVAQLQQQQRSQQSVSPTVGRAQQTVSNPVPDKAMQWWQKNNWFNQQGFERETATARAIDVQIEAEGFDKNSDDYYEELNNRLQKVFPELISGTSPNKTKVKSRQPVAPTTGGSSYKGNRVRMTKDQLAMARELGINDEQSLKKYEAEIRKQQRS